METEAVGGISREVSRRRGGTRVIEGGWRGIFSKNRLLLPVLGTGDLGTDCCRLRDLYCFGMGRRWLGLSPS